jgi:hypothetical protein
MAVNLIILIYKLKYLKKMMSDRVNLITIVVIIMDMGMEKSDWGCVSNYKIYIYRSFMFFFDSVKNVIEFLKH